MRVDQRPIEGDREQSRDDGLDAVHTDGHSVSDKAIEEFMNRNTLDFIGAEGGNRTRTPLARPRILSPVRLPVPPPRHI
jgi:hypothetical protein